jgi:hypothetical protein
MKKLSQLFQSAFPWSRAHKRIAHLEKIAIDALRELAESTERRRERNRISREMRAMEPHGANDQGHQAAS